jgi:hypothetical protein
MAIAELALIVVAFGAMAIVFGAQERREERRALAWAEETLARLAAEARTVEPAAGEDDAVEAPAHAPGLLVGAA